MPSLLHVDLRVEVNGAEADKDWQTLKMVQDDSKHVVAVLTYRQKVGTRSVGSGRSYFRDRSRIKIVYGVFPASVGKSTTFTGYISGHKVSSTKKDRRGRYVQVTYYIIGSSYPLQATHNWSGHSWSSAAKAVAKRHKMRAIVKSTPRLSRPITQTTSDFKFLAEGAKACGFRFYVDGANLFFVEHRQMLNSEWTRNIPTFFKANGNSAEIFELEVTSEEEVGATKHVVQGTAPSGQAIQDSTVPAEVYTDVPWDDDVIDAPAVVDDSVVVESHAEAQQAVAAKTRKGLTWMTASMEAVGSVKVRPGVVISLGGDVEDDQFGLWITKSVTHIIDISKNRSPHDAYRIEAVLGRDRMLTIPIPAAQEPAAPESVAFTTDSTEVPWEATSPEAVQEVSWDAVAVNGAWQADYYGEVNV